MERPKADAHDPSHHVLLDQDGHEYLAPCTPPSQATPANTTGCGPAPIEDHKPEKDLQLHFTDRPDPGCSR
jgi:hypothetical protein